MTMIFMQDPQEIRRDGLEVVPPEVGFVSSLLGCIERSSMIDCDPLK